MRKKISLLLAVVLILNTDLQMTVSAETIGGSTPVEVVEQAEPGNTDVAEVEVEVPESATESEEAVTETEAAVPESAEETEEAAVSESAAESEEAAATEDAAEVAESAVEVPAAYNAGEVIASGTYENITWEIDADGKLTVEGFGDFAPEEDMYGYDRAPWNDYCDQIITAEVNVTDMTDASYMFMGCVNLSSVNLSNFNTSSVERMRYMFGTCSKLESLDLSNFVTDRVTDMFGMFGDCMALQSLDLRSFDTSSVQSMGYMFSGCSDLTSLNLDSDSFDTGSVIDMSGMFSGCSRLTSIDLSSFDTRNVTIIHGMFGNCSSLTSLDLSKFNISNVTDISEMFTGCSRLTSLNLSSFDTSKVTDMHNLVYGCTNLTSIDLGGINTSNVTNISGMFDGCSSLTGIDLSRFNTSKVEYIAGMFRGCSSLTSIDLSSFDISNVVNGGGGTSGVFSNSDLKALKTPQVMGTVTVTLPYALYDDDDNPYTELTSACAGKTLTRQSKASSYKVVFDGNGHTSGSMLDQYIGLNETQKLFQNLYKRKGYFFAGWNTAADGKGTAYADAESVLNLKSAAGEVIHLFAQWTGNPYTLYFNGNSATGGSMAPIAGCVYGQDATLAQNAFTKTGHTFAGWTINPDGTGDVYENGSVFHIDDAIGENEGAVTLYAKWTPNQYTIKFDGNGSTSGTMADMANCDYGKQIKLSKNAFEKDGCRFTGWNTAADGKATSYTDEGTVENLTEKNGEAVTLYAQWKQTKFAIMYNLSGGTNSAKNPAAYEEDTDAIELDAPTRDGYEFEGWFTDSEYQNQVTEIAKGSKGILVLYAKWKKFGKYKIVYSLDGGTNSDNNEEGFDETSKTFVLSAPTREGYTFGGWYSDSAFKTKVTTIAEGSTGNKVLYAKWTANKYTVRFNSNGASGKMSNLKNKVYGTRFELPENKFKRKGFVFVGWNTEPDGSGTAYRNRESVENLTGDKGGTVVLYAQWMDNVYPITYRLNGGINDETNPDYYAMGLTRAISLKSPTKPGYHFDGWYTDSKYRYNTKNIPSGSVGKVTLYAKWTPNKYKIVFDGNKAGTVIGGGRCGTTVSGSLLKSVNGSAPVTGMMTDLSDCTYGKKYTLPANKFTRTGYKFIGWNTEADGSGKGFKNKASVKNLSEDSNGKVTLYAQWELENYKVTYKLGKGRNDGENPIVYNQFTETITLKKPTRAGYEFDGWYTSSKYTEQSRVTQIQLGTTGNKTLYAKWKK